MIMSGIKTAIIHFYFQKHANTLTKKKKISRYINENLEISSNDSDEEASDESDKEASDRSNANVSDVNI